MKVETIEAVVRALNDADVPFIVVGGLAVVAHGYGRLTHDLDLVVQLVPGSIVNAFMALADLGYRPRVPVTAEGFADPEQRQCWITERGMTVLNFHSDLHRETPIDVFVEEPFQFADEYRQALRVDLGPAVSLRVVRLEMLLEMKARAGRPQDLADIAELRLLHHETGQ